MKVAKRWLEVMQSVVAAFFGVQTEKKYHSDFQTHQSPIPFIIIGIIMLMSFIGFVWFLVKIAI